MIHIEEREGSLVQLHVWRIQLKIQSWYSTNTALVECIKSFVFSPNEYELVALIVSSGLLIVEFWLAKSKSIGNVLILLGLNFLGYMILRSSMIFSMRKEAWFTIFH